MFVFGVILIHIFPAFSPIWTEYGEIWYLSVFSPNAGKCGRNADENNSEYGHFYAVENCQVKLSIIKFLTERTSSSWFGIELRSSFQIKNLY